MLSPVSVMERFTPRFILRIALQLRSDSGYKSVTSATSHRPNFELHQDTKGKSWRQRTKTGDDGEKPASWGDVCSSHPVQTGAFE